MRRLALLLLACGCRNVLGIPEEGVLSYAVGGRLSGAKGASDSPIVLTMNGQRLTVTNDGPFVFPEGIEDFEPYSVRATPNCAVSRGDSTIASATVDTVDVTCDGLLALGDFGFTAPLDVTPALGSSATTYTAHGSLLTQSTRAVPAGIYPETATAAAYQNGTPTTGELDLGGAALVVKVSNQAFAGPVAPREFTAAIDLAGPIAQFGFGKPIDSAIGDRFGSVIAADGPLMVVGVPDRSGGQAIVFERDGRTWTQKQVLTMPGTSRFGAAVAIFGTTIAVGDPDAASGVGGAYAFKPDASGTWQPLIQKIGTTGSRLGSAVAVSSSHIAFGAPNDGGKGTVLIFRLSDSMQQPSLVVPSLDAGDRFGAALAIVDSAIVVGAPGDASSVGDTTQPADNLYPSAGAAYVFTGTPFALQRTLKATVPGPGDEYGAAVAIAEGASPLVAVGARYEDSSCTAGNNNAVARSGAVYLHAGAAAPVRIKAANCKTGDAFGSAIALAGSVLAVGAPFENASADGVHADATGTDEAMPDAGAAYVYDVRAPAMPTLKSYLKASDPKPQDDFGATLALTKDALLVGAPLEDAESSGWNGAQDGGAPDADRGAVYTFR